MRGNLRNNRAQAEAARGRSAAPARRPRPTWKPSACGPASPALGFARWSGSGVRACAPGRADRFRTGAARAGLRSRAGRRRGRPPLLLQRGLVQVARAGWRSSHSRTRPRTPRTHRRFRAGAAGRCPPTARLDETRRRVRLPGARDRQARRHGRGSGVRACGGGMSARWPWIRGYAPQSPGRWRTLKAREVRGGIGDEHERRATSDERRATVR